MVKGEYPLMVIRRAMRIAGASRFAMNPPINKTLAVQS
jgi:hypothetical protein